MKTPHVYAAILALGLCAAAAQAAPTAVPTAAAIAATPAPVTERKYVIEHTDGEIDIVREADLDQRPNLEAWGGATAVRYRQQILPVRATLVTRGLQREDIITPPEALVAIVVPAQSQTTEAPAVATATPGPSALYLCGHAPAVTARRTETIERGDLVAYVAISPSAGQARLPLYVYDGTRDTRPQQTWVFEDAGGVGFAPAGTHTDLHLPNGVTLPCHPAAR